MSKVIIQTPVFFQKSIHTPLYQLLSFEPGTEVFRVQNVSKGCESPAIPLAEIETDKLFFNINHHNHVQGETGLEIIERLGDNATVLEYLNGLGINTLLEMALGEEPVLV